MTSRDMFQYCPRMLLVCGFVIAGLVIALMPPALHVHAQSLPDPAYGAINPSYRPSDSPLLRLPKDKWGWPPIVPPKPREVGEVEDPTAVEVFNVATGEVTRLPSSDPTQQPIEADLTECQANEGLLPPGLVPKTVFPPDDRVQISPTTTYPWRTICKLFITAADGSQWVGSGAIIGCPDGHGYHILTAGHCIYMHDHGGWISSLEVVPGLDYDYMPFHHAWATLLRTYTGWTQYQMMEHDWAVVTLDRNVGDFTGWMGRRWTSDMSWYEGWFHCAGYPVDRDCGDPGSAGLCMYYDADYGCQADEYRHWYHMDTFGGQSGMPIYDLTDGSRYINTVHAYGEYDVPNCNSGTRLNQDKFDRIITWCNEDTPPTDYADLIDDGQMWSGFNPTTVTRGQTSFNVWCDVRNIGTAASGGFYVSYYASTNTIITTSDYLIGTDYVSSISPFSYADSDWLGTFPSSVPAGEYWVGWIIDSGNNVTEFDETNNTSYKDSYKLTVEDPSSIPPEAIDDLAIELAGSDILLWWTEPYDDVGVIRYVIYRSTAASSLGDSLTGTADTTYTDVGAAGNVGTNYFYTVKAVDGDGNKSEDSNQVGEFDTYLINEPGE